VACLMTASRHINAPNSSIIRYSLLVILGLLVCTSFGLAAPKMWEYLQYYN